MQALKEKAIVRCEGESQAPIPNSLKQDNECIELSQNDINKSDSKFRSNINIEASRTNGMTMEKLQMGIENLTLMKLPHFLN